VGSPSIPLGGNGDVAVTTTNALTVGSTDVVVNFDPNVLQAVSASSSTLSSFTAFIDNVSGRVSTASASSGGDGLAGGDPLLTVNFTPASEVGPGTVTTVSLSDGDGDSCDDLTGPVPPIPPVSLPYDQVPGQVLVGTLGDVDCDGSLTPIDASVILGLFVGNIVDSDLPPPCDDPNHRLAVGDWDLVGTLNPIDASITLGIFVGSIDVCDTPLGKRFPGLCPESVAASSIRSSGLNELNEGGSSTVLQVRDARARPGRRATVEVKTKSAIEVGSSGLALSFDASALRVVSVESSLDGFTHNVEEGVIRTASAGLGQSLAAKDVLVSVVFEVAADAAPGRYAVGVVSSGVRAPSLSGPVAGRMPDTIDVEVRSGAVRVLRGRGPNQAY
jgi:hypothetical protein